MWIERDIYFKSMMAKNLAILPYLLTLISSGNAFTWISDISSSPIPPLVTPTPYSCTTIIMHMEECRPYFVYRKSRPRYSCCHAVETFAATNEDCFCNDMRENDLPWNVTRALIRLPYICDLPLPCYAPAPSPILIRPLTSAEKIILVIIGFVFLTLFIWYILSNSNGLY